ncbi:MAG: ABC transporter permease [Anaerobacillus sp.]
MKEIWSERFGYYMKHRLSYVTYILQGGLLIALIIGGAIGIGYYKRFLNVISDSFPSALVVTIMISTLMSLQGIKVFLLPPDKVFMTPFEGRMKSYFKRSYVYSFLRTVPRISIAYLISVPLLMTSEHSYRDLLYYGIFIIGLTLLSLYIIFQIYQTAVRYIRFSLFALNFAILFFLFEGYFLIALLSLFLLIWFAIFLQKRKSTLKWEQLIELEASQTAAFEQLANQFVDVPALRNSVKRRLYLSWLIQLFPVTEPQLYRSIHAFFRKGSYIWIYIRLIVIGAILQFYFKGTFIIYMILPFVLWISQNQIMSIKKELVSETFIAPLQRAKSTKSLNKLIFTLLTIETVTFSLVQLPYLIHATLCLVVGLSLAYILTKETRHQQKR